MAIGTPNPDFNAEPWCTEEPAAPERLLVQEDVPPAQRAPVVPETDA